MTVSWLIIKGLEFDMKYHILNDFKTNAPFKGKSSDNL